MMSLVSFSIGRVLVVSVDYCIRLLFTQTFKFDYELIEVLCSHYSCMAALVVYEPPQSFH